MPDWYRMVQGELILNLCVQARARRDTIRGPSGDCLKVQICATPTDGKANVYLCNYLAGIFGVKKSAVRVLSGETARRKRVGIQWHKPTLPEVLVEFGKASPSPRNS
jgi:uncharacterized protein (TIGR00251 family)